jgi:hypothetical protein
MAGLPQFLRTRFLRSFADRAIARAQQKKRLLFVNKKKQKNFINLGRACFSATGPVQQNFWRHFFKKWLLSFSF